MDYSRLFKLSDDVCYLNHAAVSPWPQATCEAVQRFAEENARFGSRHYPRWLETEQRLRDQLRDLIHATGSDEIALLKSTSEGLSVVAHGLPWKSGDNLVIPDSEFPSNRIVWESLREQGVEIRYANLATADPEQAILALCDARTRLVSVSSVQYAGGLRLDLQRLGEFCAAQDIRFCVDAIQSLGALPFDVQQVQADFVVADGHKWLLGPEGLALFYCRTERIPELTLHQYGWHMVEAVGDFDRSDWRPADSARRFECGSPNMLGIHALHASLSVILDIGLDNIAVAIAAKIQRLTSAIQSHADRYTLLSPTDPARRAGILTFTTREGDNQQLFQHLQRVGIQCAERGGGIRFSPHFYTPDDCIDYALEHIAGAPTH